MEKVIQKYKIFGRKKGRKLENCSTNNLIKKYQLNTSSDFNKKNIILDIGSGNGENAIFLSKKYSDKLIIASDIYTDGNLNLCTQLDKKNINNVKIFDNNILLLFEKFNSNNTIDEIWILFPDPWPKKKHHKRRLIDSLFFENIDSFINKKGKIFIATDSNKYLYYILKAVYNTKLFKWINNVPYKWMYYYYNNLPKTKYYKRACRNGKFPFILILEKI